MGVPRVILLCRGLNYSYWEEAEVSAPTRKEEESFQQTLERWVEKNGERNREYILADPLTLPTRLEVEEIRSIATGGLA